MRESYQCLDCRYCERDWDSALRCSLSLPPACVYDICPCFTPIIGGCAGCLYYNDNVEGLPICELGRDKNRHDWQCSDFTFEEGGM